MDTTNTQGVGRYGTGLFHALDRIGLPIGDTYYRELLQLMETLTLALAFGGLAHPGVRHRKDIEVCERKLAKLEKLLHALIEWGHSQGGLQAVAHAFRPGSRTKVVMCFATPLNGAKAADPFRFMRRVPHWLRWPMDGVVGMMTGSEDLKHLHEKIERCMADPDFELPHVILVADYHDVLVSVESQLYWPEGYPADKLHRALVINGPAPDLPGVDILQTGKWRDNHAMMVLTKELIDWLVAKLDQLEDEPLAA